MRFQHRQNVHCYNYWTPDRLGKRHHPNMKRYGDDPKIDQKKGYIVQMLRHTDSRGFVPVPARGANTPRTRK